MFTKCFARIILQYVLKGSGSWKYNHYFTVAKAKAKEKCMIILETEETEEVRRDEHLRQVILPRISCRQRFGVSRAWRVSIPTPFHSCPGKRKMIWSLVFKNLA